MVWFFYLIDWLKQNDMDNFLGLHFIQSTAKKKIDCKKAVIIVVFWLPWTKFLLKYNKWDWFLSVIRTNLPQIFIVTKIRFRQSFLNVVQFFKPKLWWSIQTILCFFFRFSKRVEKEMITEWFYISNQDVIDMVTGIIVDVIFSSQGWIEETRQSTVII